VYGSINLTLDFIGLDERFVNEGMQATPMDIAFLIATHSYCSRFGGRRFARPGRNVRGVTTHAEGKEEGHEEKGQEVQEEEIGCVDTINAYVAGRSRVSLTGAGREG
jgi:hypothetical protein